MEKNEDSLKELRNIFVPTSRMETESESDFEKSSSDSRVDDRANMSSDDSDSSFESKAKILQKSQKQFFPSTVLEPQVVIQELSAQSSQGQVSQSNQRSKIPVARRSLTYTTRNPTENQAAYPQSLQGSVSSSPITPVRRPLEERHSLPQTLKRVRETSLAMPKKFQKKDENIDHLFPEGKLFKPLPGREVYLGCKYSCDEEVWDLMVAQKKPTIFGQNLAMALIPPAILINRAVKLSSCDPQPITPRSPRKQLSDDFWKIYKHIFSWYLQKNKITGPERAKLLFSSTKIVSKKISTLRANFVAGRNLRNYLTVEDIEVDDNEREDLDENLSD